MIGAWWRKNVIEKVILALALSQIAYMACLDFLYRGSQVHALAYSGKFTVKSPRLFMAIQGLYIAAPLVAG
ncbi:hypothetical protein T484DRAFT_1813816 [Baffinella frigidus]|nr:hypothetical protein T484DRAFT_1813816 [Cryptophyta sp. CCMP2293]